MTAVLLSVHVLAAIVLIGPITVAASVFPRYARAALSGPEPAAAAASAAAMHRISRVYATLALAVPLFGIATAAALDVLGEAWVIVSMLLTLLAAVLLVVVIVPGQRSVLAELDPSGSPGRDLDLPGRIRRLASVTGIFATTWAVVVVLMIIRPGSSTGV